MSPVNRFGVWAFAAGALAVPNSGLRHAHHHYHRPGTDQSGLPQPYASPNGTDLWANTGTGFATGSSASASASTLIASAPSASTAPGPVTVIVSPVPYPSSSVTVNANTAAVSAAGTTTCTTDITITTTERTYVTVTATGQALAAANATASSPRSTTTITVLSTYYATTITTSTPNSTVAAAAVVSSNSTSPLPALTSTVPASFSSEIAAAVNLQTSSTSASSVSPAYSPAIKVQSDSTPSTLTSAVASPSSIAAPTSASAPVPSATSGSAGSSGSWPSGPKRGLAYNDASLVKPFTGSPHFGFAYNWGSTSGGFTPTGQIKYIPLLWGTRSDFTTGWSKNAQAAIDAGSEVLFSFNEPDMSTQANMSPQDAAAAYKQYMQPFAGKAKLCAPAVTNGGGSMGLTWLSNFLAACSDCTIDCISIHWYASSSLGSYFKQHVTNATAVAAGRPVYVSEFGTTDGSDAEISSFLQDVMPWMDSNKDIAGYSYFMVSNGLLLSGSQPSGYGSTFMSYTA